MGAFTEKPTWRQSSPRTVPVGNIVAAARARSPLPPPPGGSYPSKAPGGYYGSKPRPSRRVEWLPDARRPRGAIFVGRCARAGPEEASEDRGSCCPSTETSRPSSFDGSKREDGPPLRRTPLRRWPCRYCGGISRVLREWSEIAARGVQQDPPPRLPEVGFAELFLLAPIARQVLAQKPHDGVVPLREDPGVAR